MCPLWFFLNISVAEQLIRTRNIVAGQEQAEASSTVHNSRICLLPETSLLVDIPPWRAMTGVTQNRCPKTTVKVRHRRIHTQTNHSKTYSIYKMLTTLLMQ